MTGFVKIKLLNEHGRVPKRGNDFAVGFDLYASEEQSILPGQTKLIGLGFATEFHPSVHFKVQSRSGTAKRGMQVPTGIIDCDYRGEWKLMIFNASAETIQVEIGDRIGQAVMHETLTPIFEVVEELSDTTRGDGGWGSTGAR